LLKQNRQLFHTADLSLLWGVTNNNTLYTTIKRYLNKGVLIPIHKGFYSTVPADQINPYNLMQGYLHRYCYISCETVLISHGVIFQKGNYITAVSQVSKKFTLANNDFFVRKLKDDHLYNDRGVVGNDGVMIAGLERAVADMLYYSPRYHFDNRKIINWKMVRKIQREVGYR